MKNRGTVAGQVGFLLIFALMAGCGFSKGDSAEPTCPESVEPYPRGEYSIDPEWQSNDWFPYSDVRIEMSDDYLIFQYFDEDGLEWLITYRMTFEYY